MRNMDKSGRGHLSNDKVFMIMKDQLQAQSELFKVRHIIYKLYCVLLWYRYYMWYDYLDLYHTSAN